METKHTPTPWEAVNHSWCTTGIYAVDKAEGGTIAVLDIQAEADEETQPELERWMAANAEFIVRACNAHDQLAKALLDIAEDAEGSAAFGAAEDAIVALGDVARAARAALAAAGAA